MIPFKAMILAAGLGTRLRPLTLSRPKVLVPVQTRPLLHWLVEYLRLSGAEAVIINAHHLGGTLVDYVDKEDFGIPVEVRVEESILGTGGGIRNVVDFWDNRPFVVINGDILSSIDIQEVLRSHQRSAADATVVLTDDPQFNTVTVAEDGRITSFRGGPGPHLAFTGIQVLTPGVLEIIPTETAVSIIDCYLDLMAAGGKVMAHAVHEPFWRELGSLAGYHKSHHDLFHLDYVPLTGLRVNMKSVVHSSARLGSGVSLDGMVCIGAGCELGGGVQVQNSVLWDKVQVRTGCTIRNCIIADRVVVQEPVSNAVLVA
jgi:mannose-1-phosphate guanylyltransferase